MLRRLNRLWHLVEGQVEEGAKGFYEYRENRVSSWCNSIHADQRADES